MANYPVGKRTKVKSQVGLYIYRGKGIINNRPKLCYYFTHGNGRFVKVGWNYEGYSLEDAKLARADFIRKLRHGDTLPDKKNQITFADAWALYKEYAEDINDSSLKGDTSKYRTNVKKALGNKPIKAIRNTDVARMMGKLDRKGLSPSTRQGYLSMVRRVFKFLQDEGIHSHDPTQGLSVKGDYGIKERYLTKGEIRDLLGAALPETTSNTVRHKEMYGQIILGLEMGFRRSEMFTNKSHNTPDRVYSLRWEQIDWDNNVIYIRGKGRKNRKLSMTENVRRALQDLGSQSSGEGFQCAALPKVQPDRPGPGLQQRAGLSESGRAPSLGEPSHPAPHLCHLCDHKEHFFLFGDTLRNTRLLTHRKCRKIIEYCQIHKFLDVLPTYDLALASPTSDPHVNDRYQR